MRAAAEFLGREFGEPALDEVEPVDSASSTRTAPPVVVAVVVVSCLPLGVALKIVFIDDSAMFDTARPAPEQVRGGLSRLTRLVPPACGGGRLAAACADENERRFAEAHADVYEVVVVTSIDLNARSGAVPVHEGALTNDAVSLTPRQWKGVLTS